MNCKNKNCKYTLKIEAENGDFICSGFNKKPTKHKKDNVWLCLKNKYVKNKHMEMTKEEALTIISVLSLTVSGLTT